MPYNSTIQKEAKHANNIGPSTTEANYHHATYSGILSHWLLGVSVLDTLASSSIGKMVPMRTVVFKLLTDAVKHRILF